MQGCFDANTILTVALSRLAGQVTIHRAVSEYTLLKKKGKRKRTKKYQNSKVKS